MICDMCGMHGKMFRSIVEDAEMTLCEKCSRFGKVISVVESSMPQTKVSKATIGNSTPEPQLDKIEVLVDDYASKIKKKRENLGMTQKEFAKKMKEKESIIQKIESGHFEPPITMAKKFSSILKINLVEEFEDRKENVSPTKSDALTIGDLIKIKKKN